MTAAASATTLPNLLVIGAMRAGSTSLHQALSEHPEIFMSQPKELHFFVAERNWRQGVPWYAQQFTKGAHKAVRGEASVTYTQSPQLAGVAGRAASVVPQARLVYVVREPIERMRSQYEHDVRRAVVGTPPAGWSRIGRYGSAGGALLGQPKYVDASSYALQLDQWLEHYPAGRVCVITSEWLWQEPRAAMREVFGFLGVDTSWVPRNDVPHLNRATRFRTRPRAVGHPVLQGVARALPGTVKTRLRRREALQPDLQDMVEISPDVRAELQSRLAVDVRRIRPYVRGPFDGWGIA
ncbi:MAG: sulfotransferase family protein [Actinomycetes bacterium]